MLTTQELEDGLTTWNERQLKDLHHLRMTFPNKSKEYLARKYSSCQDDVHKTMKKVAREIKGSPYQNLLTTILAFFCCGSEGSSDESCENSTYSILRNRAKEYAEQSRNYTNKAEDSRDANNKSLADYYFLLARFKSQLSEQTNARAVLVCLKENDSRNRNEFDVDLHFLNVKPAIQVLDYYLDLAIYNLRSNGEEKRDFLVVTGWGKHSKEGLPKVKPAVLDRLERRHLSYVELNQGRFRVTITRDSRFTNDFKEAF